MFAPTSPPDFQKDQPVLSERPEVLPAQKGADMGHATPDGAVALPSVAVSRPRGWPLREYPARLCGRIRRFPVRRKSVHRGGHCTPVEDLLTAGAWRNPFLDVPHPGIPKSPRITIYNG